MATLTTNTITDFFRRLADEPELLAEYARDPERTMASAGLDPAQIATVLEGDPHTLGGAIADEFAADPVRRRLIVTPRMVIHTPLPAPEPTEPPEPSKPPPQA
ncbi:MAG TPA: hypothetical protein VE753_06380 [Gaiellaceae bacterium]|jgi:hypothetical protein|nr:hypothetical protein [Gaiellaceae bacterium]